MDSKIITPKSFRPVEITFPTPLPQECCAKCRFWNRAGANQADPSMNPAAECWRYPPKLMLIPVQMSQEMLAQMRVDPRMRGQLPPGAVPMTQQLRPIRDITAAEVYCGEFDPLMTPIAPDDVAPGAGQ